VAQKAEYVQTAICPMIIQINQMKPYCPSYEAADQLTFNILNFAGLLQLDESAASASRKVPALVGV
jgi:hypothetical protein